MKCFVGFLVSLGVFSISVTHAGQDKLDVFDTLQKTQFWGLIRADQRCVEKYDFMPSGKVAIASDKERVTGTYRSLEHNQTSQLPAIVINFQTDNTKSDCSGDSTNQASTLTINFLKKESDQKIYFCNDPLGQDCPVYLEPRNNFLNFRSGISHVKQFALKMIKPDDVN